MKKVNYYMLILLSLLLLLEGCKTSEDTRPPNIVLIMGDDIGYEVLGCNGGKSYNTPNLDALAETGIRFTHCYSTPKCSPSRVKIMTGRYAFRTTKVWGYIPPDEITFGHVLQKAGYKVALAGKWQMALLNDDPDHISKMGFPENSVFGWHEGPRYYQPMIYENGKVRDDVKDKYGPDVFCNFLIDFIKRNKDKPFLAYYPMTIAHEISNDLKVPPPPGPDGRYQSFKELVEYMDKLVGGIVETLNELNLRDNTLILFTGDNGTPMQFITNVVDGEYIGEPVFSEINGRMVQGGKSKLTDAGTHVPLIANWKGTAPAGTINNDLIDFSDFMPTLAELAHQELPANVIIDGKSFAPRIKGLPGKPRDWIYNEYEDNYWIRNHKWKLYGDGKLFNMENDPDEESPVNEQPDSIKNVRDKFNDVLQQLRSD